ncbi:PDCD2 domain-containing protein [Plasmodium brasilianum]|uniref:Programmed cell death protein 2 C-terminal domain-containing protein n=2 Tax=Plasmodium (Plasmodium) TaxID=418103 RepID=A0A1A8W0L7_PLAMA|nr:conserved Plasmodium protein, unknown function [Plasmodium malariae]KAI4839716.1 PDCD2 domain-containing protein [Plasmodium brasilianum]SBS86428.1 conserved Plasmodium protein, unknown function [Plasmodium malariae]SBT86658.1 conserved Plasmodium protein, unknown function [Plasmodium malariae]
MYIGLLSHEIDNNFNLKNDSKFGGDPLWLCGKEPTGLNLKCSICKNSLTFLFQISTSYDEYVRVLYFFCCMNSTKCNVNKNSWVCIKGKKKVCDNSNNDIEEKEQKNKLKMLDMYQNESVKKDGVHNSIFFNDTDSNNCSTKEKGKQCVFNFTNENIKKEDVNIEYINSKEEKLIDWNSLFSKSSKDQKLNDSFLGNSIRESLNCINEKYKNGYSSMTSSNIINTYENFNNKYDKLINCSCKMDDNVHELNKHDDKLNPKIYEVTGSSAFKLPCYYICIVEDDEEYGKDYLYEKAKKMHETYEHNKHFMKDEEYIDKENDNIDDINNIEESFENDFNGCVKFYSYLSKNYNQILRYSYNGKFLYMYKSTKFHIKKKTMTCTHCKNKLVFELQLFSTFIYEIEKRLDEKKKNSLKNILNNFNVGNVIIFTCEKDCVIIDNMYLYEHVELEIF